MVSVWRPRPSIDQGVGQSILENLTLYGSNDVIVVLMIGQSWAEGRLEGNDTWPLATYRQDGQFRNTRIWVKPDTTLADNGSWEFLNETTNNFLFAGVSATSRRPPVIQMATTLEALYPDTPVYIVAHARGGTGLFDSAEWAVNGTLRRLYIEHILRPALTSFATLPLVNIRVMPLLTFFGARDGELPANANEYANRLLSNTDSLIAEIRNEFGLSTLPAGVFRLRDNWASRIPEFATISTQVDLMAQDSSVIIVDSDNYTDGNDDLHFDGRGTREFAIDSVYLSLQQGLTDYDPPLTLLSAVLTGTSGEAGQIVTITYNQPLDDVSSPAPGDFSLALGRTVTSVSFPAETNTVALGFDTPYNSEDTVTAGYTQGSIPLSNTDGDQAAAFTNQAVTNALQATAGTILTFTNRSPNTSESNGTYTAATGGGSYSWFMVADQTIPANTDGSVIIDQGGANTVIGFDDDSILGDFNDGDGYNVFAWVLSGNFTTRRGSGGGSIDSGIAYQAGDVIRIRRAGTTIFVEKSSDSQITWDLINSFNDAESGLGTAEIFVKVNLGANGDSVTDVLMFNS